MKKYCCYALSMAVKKIRRRAFVSAISFLLILLTGCGVLESESRSDMFLSHFRNELLLENKHISIGVTPFIGRITRFSRRNGTNILWLNSKVKLDAIRINTPSGWLNYGGDRLWPEIQSSWRHTHGRLSPDPEIDGGEWIVLTHTSHLLIMRSRPSRSLGVYAERRIELDPVLPRITIQNSLTQTRNSAYPVQLWSITQIPPAKRYYLHLRQNSGYPLPDGYKIFSDEWGNISFPLGNKVLQYAGTRDTTSKIGSYGDWMAAVTKEGIFLQISPFNPDECYPDNAAAEVFTRPEYAELEFIGGLRHLKAGESFNHTVIWELLDIPAKEEARFLKERVTEILQLYRNTQLTECMTRSK